MEQYTQQIDPIATQATVPEEIHPVAAAFGGDIGEALEQGGEKVASRLEALNAHLARMNYYRGKAQEADILSKYKEAYQNKTYGDPSDPNATVTAVNGRVIPKDLSFQPGQSPSDVAPQQTTEIPAGIYNRKGYAAAGSLEDFDNWHHMASDQAIEQAKGLGLRNVTALRSQMDSAWASERNAIAKHEATETDKAQQQTFFKGMQLDADNAVTKQDPISLGRTIDSIQQSNKVLNDSQGKSVDDPIRQITEDQFVTKALNNSMTANLKNNGGNPEQFQSILDKLHTDGKINDTVYENAQQHLDKVSTSIMRQNERVAKVSTLNTNMNFLKMTMDNKIDFSNPNVLADISMRSPMAGEAISKYVENKDIEVPDKEVAFADATKQVATFKSAEEFQTYAFNEMKKYPNGISQERFNILMGYGMKRAENLKELQDDAGKSSHPMQDAYDGAMKALFGWNKDQGKEDGKTYEDYMKLVQKNVPPSEAYNKAIANSAIRSNPTVTTIPKDGKLMIDKFGNRATVYPDGTFKELTAEPKKDENGV